MRLVYLLLLPLLCLPAAALAEETLVPWDSEGRVESLEGSQATRLGVLSEYPGLVEARLYQEDTTGTFTLEVVQRREERTVRQRVPLTPEQAEALRQQVGPGLAAAAKAPAEVTPPPVAPSRAQESAQARAALVTTSTLFGLGLYSWGVPVGLATPNATAGLGIGMLSAGASFFTPLLLTSNTEVTWGTVNMLYAGMSRGAVHGLLATLTFGSQGQLNNPFLPMSLLSLAEGVGGAVWASHSGMSAGTARTILAAHDFGLGYTTALLFLAGPSLGDYRVLTGSLLAGGLVGAIGGYHLAASRNYNWSEAEAISTAGLLGAYLVAPVVSWFPGVDTRAWVGTMMVTSAGAMVLADSLLRGKGLTGVSGFFITLGSSAGAAAGLGVGYLLSQDPRVILPVSLLGAVGGYIASAAVMLNTPKVAFAPNVQVRVDPTALALLNSGSQPQGRRPQVPPPPVVALQGSF